MAEKKKMSVAEILAAARKADKKDAGGEPPAEPAAESKTSEPTAAPAEPAGEKPAAKPPAAKPAAKPAAGGAHLSVAEMMAAARAEKAKAAGGEPPAAKPAAPKPAATPKADKPAAKPAAAKGAKAPGETVVEKDTASILAAARSGVKPGPMSKAEAAAKGEPVAKAPLKPKAIVPPMPVKPEYAKPKAKPVAAGETRRGFFDVMFGSALAIGFTMLSATGALWTLGFARFMFPNVLTEPPSRFKVGFPASFAPGQVETKFVALFGVWIINYEYQGQSEIYALRTVCTHLGCTPNWLEGEQKFKCPCHGSGFYKDGINFEGPAPRPLERYAIRVADDGQLEVDKSKIFQQEMGQWNDPSCYVNA